MTLLESLKVAQEACHWEAENFGAEYTDEQIPFRYELLVEAAAVLARLETELPKLAVEIGAMADYLEDKWHFCDENSEGDLVDHVPIEVTEDFPKQLRAILSRLDAAPKEGS